MENPNEISANGLQVKPEFIRLKTGKFENFSSDYKVENHIRPPHLYSGGPTSPFFEGEAEPNGNRWAFRRLSHLRGSWKSVTVQRSNYNNLECSLSSYLRASWVQRWYSLNSGRNTSQHFYQEGRRKIPSSWNFRGWKDQASRWAPNTAVMIYWSQQELRKRCRATQLLKK